MLLAGHGGAEDRSLLHAAPAQSGACCTPNEGAPAQAEGCCTPAPAGSSACCTPTAQKESTVHSSLADLLNRYESATERAFYKALKQYQSLRTPDLQLQPGAAAPTDQHHHFHYHHHADQSPQLPNDPSPPPNHDKFPNKPTDSNLNPSPETT